MERLGEPDPGSLVYQEQETFFRDRHPRDRWACLPVSSSYNVKIPKINNQKPKSVSKILLKYGRLPFSKSREARDELAHARMFGCRGRGRTSTRKLATGHKENI